MNPLGTENASGGGVRPLTSTSYKDKLESLGHTINFIDNWLQCLVKVMQSEQVYTNRRCNIFSSKFPFLFL